MKTDTLKHVAVSILSYTNRYTKHIAVTLVNSSFDCITTLTKSAAFKEVPIKVGSI